MQLQVALDIDSLDKARELIDQVKDYADIIELGTGFMGTYGYSLVETIRKEYPDIQILADVKIVDGGYGTSQKVFRLGANISTVVGYADEPTLAGAVKAAKEAGEGHYVMADLMHVPDYSAHKEKLDKVGVDYVSAHVATDSVGFMKFEDVLARIASVKFKAKLAIAGGITLERLPIVKKYNPDLIIVGGAITRSEDPRAMAKAFKEAIS